MLSFVAGALCLAAFLAGVTGTWSPCGFSMVDTLGSHARDGRRAAVAGACATFALGALAGGALTFGTLAALGAVLGTGSRAGAVAAAVVALAAALAEARGLRVLPQVRRQVPEPWRRALPLPLAAALYGALLGLGFTTFVLTFAVWALAAIALALGDVYVGLALGLAFGTGRALPVVLLAPAPERPFVERALEVMSERPPLLRALRRADAVALVAAAAILAAGPASAAGIPAPATDPAAADDDVVWQRPGVGGFFRRAGQIVRLPGEDPALGGPYVAWRIGDRVTVARRDTLAPVREVLLPGVRDFALSGAWLAYRLGRPDGGTVIGATSLGATPVTRFLASTRAPSQLGRPAISGGTVVFHAAAPRSSALVAVDAMTRVRRTIRRRRGAQLLHPTLFGPRLLYVRSSRCYQELVLTRLARGPERVLLRLASAARRDPGHEHGRTRQGSEAAACPRRRGASRITLWTTALARRAAYVTLLARRAGGTTVPSLARIQL